MCSLRVYHTTSFLFQVLDKDNLRSGRTVNVAVNLEREDEVTGPVIHVSQLFVGPASLGTLNSKKTTCYK